MSVIVHQSKSKVRIFRTLSRNLPTFSQLFELTICSQHAKLPLPEFKNDSGNIRFLQISNFSQPPNMWNSSSKFPHIGHTLTPESSVNFKALHAPNLAHAKPDLSCKPKATAWGYGLSGAERAAYSVQCPLQVHAPTRYTLQAPLHSGRTLRD